MPCPEKPITIANIIPGKGIFLFSISLAPLLLFSMSLLPLTRHSSSCDARYSLAARLSLPFLSERALLRMRCASARPRVSLITDWSRVGDTLGVLSPAANAVTKDKTTEGKPPIGRNRGRSLAEVCDKPWRRRKKLSRTRGEREIGERGLGDIFLPPAYNYTTRLRERRGKQAKGLDGVRETVTDRGERGGTQ